MNGFAGMKWFFPIFALVIGFEKEVIMNFKNIMKSLFAAAVAVLLVLSVTSATAQDLIVKQDGESIKAYRTDIGKTAVYYQLEDNDGSPILSLPKSEVLIIKMQDGTKIVIDEVEPKVDAENNVVRDEYVPRFPAEPVADPETIAKAEIGSLIEFYDGSKGVVFYLDGNGHGLAVYLYEDNDLMYWQETSFWFDCVDVKDIPNGEKTELQMGLGALYCDAAIEQVGLGNLQAIKWCRSIGPDWYLPSLGELYELLVFANLSEGRSGPISQAIKKNGGNPFTYKSNIYLSSSEDDNTKVFSVFSTGAVKNVKKYSPHSCRAIRMF